jgi:UDP-glucose 4-epimerase
MGDYDAVSSVLLGEKIDMVMHFAALSTVAESTLHPLAYHTNNVGHTITLIRAMRDVGVARMVFSSTCAVYGIPERLPIDEKCPRHPCNPYGNSKLAIENVLMDMASSGQMSFAAFRYFNAAGAAMDGTIGEDHDPETHLIPRAIYAAMGKIPFLPVHGNCLRDYVHVDDICRAHVLVMPKVMEGARLILNLGTGTPTRTMDVIRAVEDVSGLDVPIKYMPPRAGDPECLYADAAMARQALGWSPACPSIRDIVKTAWRWHSGRP